MLIERARLLGTTQALITNETINPPQRKRPRPSDPDPGPVIYDTGLDAGEGLWLRTGWAGRV